MRLYAHSLLALCLCLSLGCIPMIINPFEGFPDDGSPEVTTQDEDPPEEPKDEDGGAEEEEDPQDPVVQPEPRAGDVIGHWRFEGTGDTAKDDSPFGNHGTLNGPTHVPGYAGHGLLFHGGGQFVPADRVWMAHSPSLAVTAPFSVEAMICARGYDKYYAIVDKYERVAEGDDRGFTLYLTDGKLRMSIYAGADGTGNTSGGADLRDDQWHHVRGAWDGTYIYLYVDGVVVARTSWTHAPAATSAHLGVGQRLCGWGGYMPFFGFIDSVVLSLIAPDSEPGSTAPPPPPTPVPVPLPSSIVGSWAFEGTGSTAVDATTYGNDGTIYGAERTLGYAGQGLTYDGGGQFHPGDKVVVPHCDSLDITGPFCITAWIRVTGSDKYYAIVDKYRYIGGDTEQGFTLYLTDGRLRMSIYGGASGNAGAMATTDLRDGVWHHVQGLWNGETIELSVDGVLEKSVASTIAPASTANNLGIGQRLSGWGGYMPLRGTIDSVVISRMD